MKAQCPEYHKRLAIGKATLWMALVSLIVFQCDDIVEEDISDDEVFLFAPADGVEVDSGSVTFVWDFLDGASNYRLLVVSPDFDAPANVYADTLLADNKFTVTLDKPGTYAWGISASNSAYATPFFVNNFTIAEGQRDTDISDQVVTYISPAAGVTAAPGNVVFLWEALAGARNYRVQIVSPTFDAISDIVFDSVTTDDRVSVALDSGQYEWQVLGINNSSQTERVSRKLLVDD